MSVRLQPMGWVRALLAFLVAVALLVAPVASMQGMPCHDLVDHEPSTVAGSGHLEVAHSDNALRGHSQAVDHTLCCSSACASCVVAFATAGATVPQRIALTSHYERRDEIVSGLALPPTLGPPRTPA